MDLLKSERCWPESVISIDIEDLKNYESIESLKGASEPEIKVIEILQD